MTNKISKHIDERRAVKVEYDGALGTIIGLAVGLLIGLLLGMEALS